MTSSERPRRPSKVILLIILLWLVGGALQTIFGLLLAEGGMLEAGTATLVGQILGWGLLVVVFYRYRKRLEDWLRT